ncbi:TPR repeat-containing protein [Cupriavidus basilensis OR16]|uniref:TPR repeat-containing protein n=1 Tax=Cupriavidus basilensis OR16 TaxID=1127483 RepID=H1S3Q5_9BURK|nr:tetratricopeptide repeat protein [Cupriavidus basilensis]EHP42829.1 TPR repeat-containing protein [Cupriavidus basilensis OR16]
MTLYTMREAQALLGIPRSVAARLIADGVVTPSRGARREYLFTFQDMVMLRTANSLREARIPSRRISRALSRLKATRGQGVPLTGVRVRAIGNEVATRDGVRQWQAESGQMLMDFEPDEAGAAVVHTMHQAPATKASAWFHAACELEAEAPGQAEQAYRRALSLDGGYLEPYLNLGCMLCDAGHFGEAVALYRCGLAHLPNEPLMHFNLAVALEDDGLQAEALASYAHCIELAPGFADAHFNAARLYESLGDDMRAIRHFNAYRKLQPG